MNKEILDKPKRNGIMTSEVKEYDTGNELRETRSTYSGRTGSNGSQVSERKQAENVGERTQGTGDAESERRETIRRESDSQRGAGHTGVEPGDQAGDSRKQQRLTESTKDINLANVDIGHAAGAATRFDTNIEAIRTLKKIEEEGRNATPDEQKILAKYSGFGDSAFGEAFPAYEWSNFKNTPWGRRREELKAITTDEEFKAIEKSRLNAFYTTPEVIKAMWAGLEKLGVGKLKNPHVLEPSAGSGRFLGYQPNELAKKAKRTAVELDSLTGRMLKYTYPETETYVMGFEKAPIPKESIDVAISNVPFGNYPIFDPSFKKDRKKMTRSIHNYFFAKTLDNLRPGGVLAFITSHATLDAPTSKPIRQELAKQANFLGAIRLPNDAFPDTQVVTDIIYMKKKEQGEATGK